MEADDVRSKARLVREGFVALLALVRSLCRRTHIMQGIESVVSGESTLVREGLGTPGTGEGAFDGVGRWRQCFCRPLVIKNSKHPR